MKDILTTGDIAKICKVSPKTVVKWIDEEMLKGYKIPSAGHRRVLRADFIQFMIKNGMEALINDTP